jgi:hypothetical protein
MNLATEGIKPLDREVPDLPHEVVALVMQMLARDRGARPQDLLEVSEVLSRVTDGDERPFAGTVISPSEAAPASGQEPNARSESKPVMSSNRSSTPSPGPACRTPPFATPPYRACPDAPIQTWFTHPAGFVTYFSDSYILDVRGAKFIIDAYFDGFRELCIPPDEKLRFVHAWVNIRRYEGRIRQMMVRWGLGIRRNVAGVDFMLAPDASPILRMGATVVEASFASIGVPVRTHFTEDLTRAIVELGLTAAQI